MKKLLVPITFTVCSISSLAIAAPNDAFLQANQLNDQGHKLNLDLAVDAVNETIDIFNIRGDEAAGVDNAGDYFGGHIHGTYQLTPQLALEAGFWQREIDYSQDTNDIQSWLVTARYTPPFNLKKNNYFDLRLSAWGNQANELNKSTPTAVNGRTINNIQVNDPSDIQVQVDAIFSKKLDPMNQLNAFASLGYSKVDISSLNLQTTYQNCLMNLNVQTNNQVTGNLAQPCRIDGVTLTDLSVQFDANEIGFDAQKDMNYDAYYASVGGSWNWRYRKFESQLAYQYQRLWRNDIDDRINSFGQTAVKDNHTFSTRLSYDLHPNVTTFLEGHLFKRNFIGTIPFLYNGVTASRLDRKYGYASLGLNLRF